MSAQAYLSGVIYGDGWCTTNIGMCVKDEDFATAFADALALGFGCKARPRLVRGKYWMVRTSNVTGRFNGLLTFEPVTDLERGAWLRGLFDSEGNATLRHLKHVSANSYERRVSIYSTSVLTLERAATYLAALGIATVRTTTKNSAGHKGTKTVYQLRVRCNRNAYMRFAELVGSSLARKAATLRAIPASYRPVDSGHQRLGQQRGAAKRRNRTLAAVLPPLLAAIRRLVGTGTKATQRACAKLPGYSAIVRYHAHSELVRMAMAL